jgi:hypothetical protein
METGSYVSATNKIKYLADNNQTRERASNHMAITGEIKSTGGNAMRTFTECNLLCAAHGNALA